MAWPPTLDPYINFLSWKEAEGHEVQKSFMENSLNASPL